MARLFPPNSRYNRITKNNSGIDVSSSITPTKVAIRSVKQKIRRRLQEEFEQKQAELTSPSISELFGN